MAYDRSTLELLAKIAQEYDLLVAADEIYTTYIYEGDYIPLRTLPGMLDRTITLNSFSKNFLMTGWRVGVIIAEPTLIATMNQINGSLIYSAPSISQRAAIAALDNRARIRERYIKAYRERIFYSADRLEKIPYLSLVRPKGTFYLFPGVEKTGLSAGEFCKELLERAHILVSPGDVFGLAASSTSALHALWILKSSARLTTAWKCSASGENSACRGRFVEYAKSFTIIHRYAVDCCITLRLYKF